MKQTMTITRWIYNEKNSELNNNIVIVDETRGTVEIEVVKVVKETDRAMNITTFDDEMNIISLWIPRTQIKAASFEIKTLEAKKYDYTEFAKFDSAVKAEKAASQLKAEGKKAFVKYVKNDCIVMVAV